MLRVRLMAPTTDHRPETIEAIAQDVRMIARENVGVSHVQIEDGPMSVRTADDERRATPGVVRRAMEAEREGVDAIVIDCTSDVGLAEARAAVRVPVIGPGETLMERTRGRVAVWLNADVLGRDPIGSAVKAVEEGADVLVIGGTGWSSVAVRVTKHLRERGDDVDVLDPLPVAVEEAVRRVRSGERTSQSV